jgi:DNA invertase Pin-like site-specific DNA recombinase
MTRAAVYVRKSTSAGLEQEFNSLDAQRESCANYARSRGWTPLAETYEDGGYTGANVERPAFQRLLADIDAKKIDVVVVYKVDRLSRSLLDFAKVMDRFHAAGAAFVSVTQNFSTADAMGRLTLNMLMSFAEFEREMIAERTRDKIAAARRRGKWTGGIAPLGYRIEASKLVVVESDARVVREIFALYLERRSLFQVMTAIGVRGRTRGARRWTKDAPAHPPEPNLCRQGPTGGRGLRGGARGDRGARGLRSRPSFDGAYACGGAAAEPRLCAARHPSVRRLRRRHDDGFDPQGASHLSLLSVCRA